MAQKPSADIKFTYKVDVIDNGTSSEKDGSYFITKKEYRIKIDYDSTAASTETGSAADVTEIGLPINLTNMTTGLDSSPGNNVKTHVYKYVSTEYKVEPDGNAEGTLKENYTPSVNINTRQISFANSLLINSSHISLGWYWLSFNNIQDEQDIGLFTFNKLLNDNIGTPYPKHVYHDSGDGVVITYPSQLLVPGIYKRNVDSLEDYENNVALRDAILCTPSIYFHDHHVDDSKFSTDHAHRTLHQAKQNAAAVNPPKNHYNSVQISDTVFDRHQWNKKIISEEYDLRPNVINTSYATPAELIIEFKSATGDKSQFLENSFLVKNGSAEGVFYKDLSTGRYYKYVASGPGNSELYLNPFGCYLVLLSTKI
jgi:hypothetical protein